MSFSTPPIVDKPTFVISSPATTLTLNKSMISVFNAGGSGKLLKLQNVWLLNSQITAVVGNVVQFDLLRSSAQTGGTSITAISPDSVDVLPGTITAATGATVTDASTLPLRSWFLGGDEIGTGTAMNQSIDRATATFAHNWFTPTVKLPTARPGEGLHLKAVQVPAAAGSWTMMMLFTIE